MTERDRDDDNGFETGGELSGHAGKADEGVADELREEVRETREEVEALREEVEELKEESSDRVAEAPDSDEEGFSTERES